MKAERTQKKQFILAVSGVKNSGKTTLITKILPFLKAKGLNVAVIKHDGHDFEADVPETDSWKFAKAGADSTLIFSKTKYMMIHYDTVLSEEEFIASFRAQILFCWRDLNIQSTQKSNSYEKATRQNLCVTVKSC